VRLSSSSHINVVVKYSSSSCCSSSSSYLKSTLPSYHNSIITRRQRQQQRVAWHDPKHTHIQVDATCNTLAYLQHSLVSLMVCVMQNSWQLRQLPQWQRVHCTANNCATTSCSLTPPHAPHITPIYSGPKGLVSLLKKFQVFKCYKNLFF